MGGMWVIDNNIQSIQNLTARHYSSSCKGWTKCDSSKGQDGNEYFVGVDEDGNLVLPEVHKITLLAIYENKRSSIFFFEQTTK